MVKKFALKSVMFLLLATASAGAFLQFFSPNLVSAQDSQNQTYTVQVDEEDKNAYYEAIKDCSTPSLECLVHYVWTYTAIESCNRILGVGNGCTMTSTTSSGNSSLNQSSVANNNNGGFVPGLNYLITQMYAHPVAQTGVYVADLMESARLAPPAYAQGLGFVSLNPILSLWKVFRNLAYLFFVFLFIIIGFMIMLRQKIGGQTALTAQQAIPSIIISLIFVTFSYAIAGFMIDLMYLSMFMIIGIFETQANFQDNIINFNIIQLMIKLFQGAAPLSFTSNLVETFLGGLTNSTAGSNVVGFIGGLTLSLVIAIAVLINTFKLFFELLRAYASLILNTVTAPLTLMMGAIPGKNVFWSWLKKIVGNLLPFPTVLIVVVMFYYFTASTRDPGSVAGSGAGFVPPFLLGRGQANTMTALMGLAIMLAMPELVKKIRETVAGRGGLGEEIASAGWNSFKKGWTGEGKMPGVGSAFKLGKKAAKGALKVGALSTVGAAGGALYGAKVGIRGVTGLKGAVAGGAIGSVAAPVAVTVLPPVIKHTSRIGKQLSYTANTLSAAQSMATIVPTLLSRSGRGGSSSGSGTPPTGPAPMAGGPTPP